MIPLTSILTELARLQPEALGLKFAVAYVNDFFLDYGMKALTPEQWNSFVEAEYLSSNEIALLKARGFAGPFATEQITYLAQALKKTSLQHHCRIHISKREQAPPDSALSLKWFLTSVRGIPLNQILKSAVRREEFVRQWLQKIQIPILGETDKQSQNELAKIDYLKMLIEADRAEVALKLELVKRERLMKELQREAQKRDSSRGGYE